MAENETTSDGTGPDDEDLHTELERLRAENAELRARHTGAGGHGIRRRWVSITCAVIATLLIPASVITVWASNTILDKDQYVETVSALADEPAIQEGVTRELSLQVNEAADFEEFVDDALPEDLSLLAGPITSAVENLVSEAIGTIVASDQFAQLWTTSNEVSYEFVRAAVTGENVPGIVSEDGEIKVDLSGVLDALGDVLPEGVADQLDLEEADAEIVLLQSDDLASVQSGLDLLDTLSWFVPLVALAFVAAAIALAVDRRLGVRRVGIAVALSSALTLLLLAIARGRFLGEVRPENEEFAAAVFDTLLRFLRQSLQVALVVGIIMLLAAWLTGPSGSALRVRSWWNTLLGRAETVGGGGDPGAVPAWVGRNEGILLGGVLVVATLVVLGWDQPTGWGILLFAVLVLAVLGVVRFVAAVGRRSGDREIPSATADAPPAAPPPVAAAPDATTTDVSEGADA
jgi:hypothetical protein